MYNNKMTKEATTHNGARVGYNRTGRRTDADACSLTHTKGIRRRCCRKHTGVPRSSASLPENLHRNKLWSYLGSSYVPNSLPCTR